MTPSVICLRNLAYDPQVIGLRCFIIASTTMCFAGFDCGPFCSPTWRRKMRMTCGLTRHFEIGLPIKHQERKVWVSNMTLERYEQSVQTGFWYSMQVAHTIHYHLSGVCAQAQESVCPVHLSHATLHTRLTYLILTVKEMSWDIWSNCL